VAYLIDSDERLLKEVLLESLARKEICCNYLRHRHRQSNKKSSQRPSKWPEISQGSPNPAILKFKNAGSAMNAAITAPGSILHRDQQLTHRYRSNSQL
jgi:hypothetical protein